MPGFQSPTSQIELQQMVERYATVFVERAGQELEPLFTLPDPALAQSALSLYLRYASSALEAATGQVPEVNVLDLLVFVVLTREGVERHWVPEVFGERARPLLVALQTSERDIWGWAEGAIVPDKLAQLRGLIDRWLETHPNQVRMEWTRFTEFAAVSADLERARTAGGILASVKAATQAADAALLLSERAIFLAQRMPHLLRVQARAGAQQMLSDAALQLESTHGLLHDGSELLKQTDSMRPLIGELVTLSKTVQQTLAETRALTGELHGMAGLVRPLLEARTAANGGASTGVEQLVLSAQTLNESTRDTMAQARELLRSAGAIGERGGEQVDRLLRRLSAYALVIGLAWAVFFWGGYYLIKRHGDPATPTARADRRG